MSDGERPGAEEIRAERIGPNQRPLIEQLWQLYVHEMSGFMDLKVNEQGRFPNLPERWWRARMRGEAFLFQIRAAGEPAGFAVVGRPPHGHHCSTPDFIMVDFFVLRRWRRRGVGSAAAREIFEQLPGRWEVSEALANPGAVAFWRKMIAGYRGGKFHEEPLKLGALDAVAQIFDNTPS